MTDERVDSLIRRLETDAMPDPAFVSQTYALLEGQVRRARREDIDPIWRLRRPLRVGLVLRGGALPFWPATARWLLIGLVLAAAVAAGLLAIGSRFQAAPERWDVVIERHGESVVGNTFYRQSFDGTRTRAIFTSREFESAMALAWSPDGRRVAYVVGLYRDQVGAYSGSEVHIADADGSHPVAADVATTPALRKDDIKRFDQGPSVISSVAWSPDSSMVAAAWSTYSCTGGPNCVPTGGIDVFRADGTVVTSFVTPDRDLPIPLWAPDSGRLGYMSGYVVESDSVVSTSATFSFRTQSVERPDDVTVVEVSQGVSVTAWTPDDRLLVVEDVAQRAGPSAALSSPRGPWLLYSMTPAGSDHRLVPGTIPGCSTDCGYYTEIRWSPDGSRIAWSRSDAEQLVNLRSALTGEDGTISLPKPMRPWGWSPDGERLLLAAGGSFDVGPFDELYVMKADGASLDWIGTAHEASWAPAP
jgi:dipeptidyl aminopeptidase/acylaminoacyl peptidase